MTDATVAADFDQALDVQGDVSAKVAFHNVMMVDVFTQLGSVFLGQVLDADVGVDAGCSENVRRGFAADPVNIGQADFDALFSG